MVVEDQPVGVCNTPLAFKTETPQATEVGIDTWRLIRYLDDDKDLRRAVRFLDGRTFQKVDNHAVGVMPGHRLMWLEGHPVVDGLAAPRTLDSCRDRVLGALDDHGLPVGRDGGVSRLDCTCTLEFPDERAGLAFLEGVSVAEVPRTKPAVYGRPPETVYLLSRVGGRKLARIYDKGVEARSAPPGRLVRLEDQRRFATNARMALREYITDQGLAEAHFRGRFAPLAESAQGLHAATLPVLAEELRRRVADGEVAYRQAERLMGYLALQNSDAIRLSQPTSWRRRKELRELGLVLVNPMEDPIDVDLGAALDAALEAWSADAVA